MIIVALCALIALLLATAIQASADSGLIGHWKLQGDCNDYSSDGNHGINHGAILSSQAAGFDGTRAYISIPDNESLQFGTGDFSISAWVKCADGARYAGDILGKYDTALRKGINLYISASAPGYSSVSDTRNVLFGIDNAVESEWVDCGRPWPSNPLVSTLIVYNGELYTGTADASDPKDACHVYRYAGGQKWIDCGRVSSDLKTPSVYSIIVHKGKLYAGTGAWDWEKAWAGDTGLNHVYRYDGGIKWHDCGQFGVGYRVMSLASYKGELYAADDKQMAYRYDGDNKWTLCGKIEAGSKIMAMMSYNNALWGASNTTIHRYDNKSDWDIVGHYDENIINQVHTLGVYEGNLYAGTWPVGRVIRYEADGQWADCGDLGISTEAVKINEVNELTTYNGKLYAGVIPKAEVYRYESERDWTMVKQLVNNLGLDPKSLPTWMRVPCMTVFQGKLYAGTSSCQGRTSDANFNTEAGKVFEWEAGKCISYDMDLGTGWKQITAVKRKGKLQLYINGIRVAGSSEFDPSLFDVSNTKPLLIGFGASNYFAGKIKDVRIYNRAISSSDIAELCTKAGMD